MNNISIRYVFDRKNQATNSKKGLLQIEVRIIGKVDKTLVSTGIKLLKNQFSDTNGFTCIKHPNYTAITKNARDTFNKVEAFVLSDKCKSLNDVKYWNKTDFSEITIIDFIESELRRRNASVTVIEYNHSFIKRLNEYGKIKSFNDITYNNIVGLDAVLRKYITSEPTLYKRHSLFKGYVQEAINRGLFKGPNPYALFKNSKGKSKDPIFLTENEIEKIKEYTPDYGYLERTKDLYLFQCFTGLAYADLMKFSKESIKEIDGYKAIQSNREKTDENFITLFLPEAERIAIKYNYELPKITNQKYNEYLKDVANGAGINKPLISHSARHTFATYLLNKDVPIETVARALGHSNIKQTQHYAKLLGKKVISDMKKLL